MRFGVCVLIAVSVCGMAALPSALSAQNQSSTPGSPPDQTSPDQQTTPPTSVLSQFPPSPLEQQNEQVRQVDPLERELERKAREKAAREAEKTHAQDETPVPGSIAASERRAAEAAGPRIAEDNDQEGPVQEYTGPAVLSRSYSITQALIPEQVKWNESVSLSANYGTGVTRTLNLNGTLNPSAVLIGQNLAWTFGGRHYFHRDQLSLNYSGNYSWYSGGGAANAYTGLNHNLALAYSHVLSRRMSLNVVTSGAFTAQNYGLQNQNAGPETIANINISSSPNIQIFDNGSKQISTQVSMVYQKTARLSFSAGGAWFGISRDSPLLIGMTGHQARGDVTYRISQRMTVGSYYSFNQYIYPHGLGNSDTHTAGAIYSYAFNRTTQLRLRGGVSVTQSLGLVTVPINPLLQQLLGIGQGVIDSYQTTMSTDISGQFIHDFRHGGTASLSYVRGISPGNGVYQTSQQEAIALTASKTLRAYSFSFGAGHDTLKAATQAVALNLGNYSSEYATLGVSRSFRHRIGMNFTAQYRHFDLQTLAYARNQINLASGLSWSSNRLWPF